MDQGKVPFRDAPYRPPRFRHLWQSLVKTINQTPDVLEQLRKTVWDPDENDLDYGSDNPNAYGECELESEDEVGK